MAPFMSYGEYNTRPRFRLSREILVRHFPASTNAIAF